MKLRRSDLFDTALRYQPKQWWLRAVDWIFRAEYIHGGTGVLHFKRWCLGALPAGRRLYLHHFVGSDHNRSLHDHPKVFVSIGLCGGYVEERPEWMGLPMGTLCPRWDVPRRRQQFSAPWIRRFPAEHIHRIRVPKRGCWTLVLTGRITREWGFWPHGRWVDWRTHLYGGRRRRYG